MPSAKPPALLSANTFFRSSFSPASSGRRQARVPKPSRNLSRQGPSPSLAGSQADQRAQLALDRLPDLLGRPDVRLGQPVGDRPQLGVVVEAVLDSSGGKSLASGRASPSRSRTVLSYSARVRRRTGDAPGLMSLQTPLLRSGAIGLVPTGGNMVPVPGSVTEPPPGPAVDPPPGPRPPGRPRRAVRAGRPCRRRRCCRCSPGPPGRASLRRRTERGVRRRMDAPCRIRATPRPPHPPPTYSSVRASSLLFLLSDLDAVRIRA